MSNLRDSIRSGIFSAKPVSDTITIFGNKVEIRQMSTGAIMDLRSDENRKEAMIRSVIGHCYVPGTNEKVFDETDIEALLEVPFSGDMVKLSEAIGKLSGVDLEIEEMAKNSEDTQTESASI